MTVGNDFSQLQGAWLTVSVSSRALLLVAAGVGLVLLRRARSPRQMDQTVQLGLAAMVLFGSVVHLSKLSTGHIQGPVIACATLICCFSFAMRGPLLPRSIAGGVFVLGGVVLVTLAGPQAAMDTQGRVATALALATLNIVGSLSASSFEQQRRKRFEAERRERQARHELSVKLRELAVEKERAEAMSHARAAFLAAMSHEFRTPMNAVIGLSDLVLDTSLSLESRAHVRTINDSARALLRLLEEILDFAKIDAQKLILSHAPFELRKLAASVIDMLRPAARTRSVELSLEQGPDVPAHVVGDDARLRQVLVNLTSNAIKFTERGTVRLRITALPPGLEHAAGDMIEFRVEDTGIGISPDVLARLFRPFTQADSSITRRHDGTGLGLAISKQIIAAMGGDILVESEPGRGSVFSFALQLAAAAAPEPAAPTLAENRPPLVVLVVEDHPVNREVARAKLARLGYPVDLACGGGEALEAIASKDYDVVFMDLQMPGMSGLETTARLGEATAGRRVPHVIAMTASLFEEDREACRRAGMYDFVGKPIDVAQLDAVLTRVAKARGAAAPSLEQEPLTKLRRIGSLGEPRFFEGLLHIFLESTRGRLPRLTEALERGDAKDLAWEAHILKSASATLGAVQMSEVCAKVEAAARQGRLEGLGAALVTLAAQFVEVEKMLRAELEGGPPLTIQEAS
ncbi:ATP-binding protein [Myxococcus eversor]|nr:ATP-binding protein [Myxococcus eversor]